MCEIKVRLEDHTNPNPEVDRRGSYKRSYVISVRPDGYDWGRMSRKSAWLAQFNKNDPRERAIGEATWHNRTALVLITDMTVAEVQPLAEEQTEDDSGVETGERFRRRRWYIDLNSIPPDRLNPWLENGEITTNRDEFVGYVYRIRDNAPWQP